jgi:heme exporter protein C
MVWQFLLFVWMSLVIVAGFLYAPLAEKLYEMTRIIYFHIPAAWVSVLAFLVSTVFSIRYLATRAWGDDARAAISAGLGLLFAVLATASGAIFAKVMWGAFWNWDPRETSIFLLLLIYGAYLTLRSAVEGEDKRARLAAVYNILAFVTVPFLVFVVPRLYFSLHPDPLLNAQGRLEMHPRMLQVFLASLAGFTMLYFWIFDLSWKVARLKRKQKEAS